MEKQRGWINGWRATWGTMSVGNKRHGSNGCILVSFSITLLFICPLACLLSNKFTVIMNPILLTTYLVIVYIHKLRFVLKKVNKFWWFWEIICRFPKINKQNMQIKIQWIDTFKWMIWFIWGLIHTKKTMKLPYKRRWSSNLIYVMPLSRILRSTA